MHLREYLFQNRLKISEFAKTINYDRRYINDVVNGTKIPGRKLAEVIQKATNGDVTVEELLKNNQDDCQKNN
jgi:plasmid maintenance system antidote protein VapI